MGVIWTATEPHGSASKGVKSGMSQNQIPDHVKAQADKAMADVRSQTKTVADINAEKALKTSTEFAKTPTAENIDKINKQNVVKAPEKD